MKKVKILLISSLLSITVITSLDLYKEIIPTAVNIDFLLFCHFTIFSIFAFSLKVTQKFNKYSLIMLFVLLLFYSLLGMTNTQLLISILLFYNMCAYCLSLIISNEK